MGVGAVPQPGTARLAGATMQPLVVRPEPSGVGSHTLSNRHQQCFELLLKV